MFLDKAGCADRGVTGRRMTSSGLWVSKIKQWKMEPVFAPGNLVSCRSYFQAALVLLLNFQAVSVGKNPSTESSLAIKLASQRAISWAVRLSVRRQEQESSVAWHIHKRTQGREGVSSPHPILPCMNKELELRISSVLFQYMEACLISL